MQYFTEGIVLCLRRLRCQIQVKFVLILKFAQEVRETMSEKTGVAELCDEVCIRRIFFICEVVVYELLVQISHVETAREHISIRDAVNEVLCSIKVLEPGLHEVIV